MVKRLNYIFAAILGDVPSRGAAALILILGAGGCGHSQQIVPPSGSTEVFFHPAKALGEKISVAGYLRYTFENRNLYPNESSAEKLREESCLPVLIKLNDKDLLDAARGLDGAYVVIDGTIENVSPPGMVSFFTCKPVGIKVSTIRRRN